MTWNWRLSENPCLSHPQTHTESSTATKREWIYLIESQKPLLHLSLVPAQRICHKLIKKEDRDNKERQTCAEGPAEFELLASGRPRQASSCCWINACGCVNIDKCALQEGLLPWSSPMPQTNEFLKTASIKPQAGSIDHSVDFTGPLREGSGKFSLVTNFALNGVNRSGLKPILVRHRLHKAWLGLGWPTAGQSEQHGGLGPVIDQAMEAVVDTGLEHPPLPVHQRKGVCAHAYEDLTTHSQLKHTVLKHLTACMIMQLFRKKSPWNYIEGSQKRQ